MRSLLFIVLISILLIQCSVVKKNDPDVQVREFLTLFQQNLQKSDDEILKQFEARQSENVILEIVKILQNKQSPLIKSEPNFAAAIITISEEGIKANIPVTLQFDELKGNDGGQAMLALWLTAKGETFVITKMEGEVLYQEFTSLKNRNEWIIAEKTEADKRAPVFARAQELEETYDSVIWYTTVDTMTYFYVVEGAWTNTLVRDDNHNQALSVKMGLVDYLGSVVIPLEYDLIGTIGFDQPGVVEIYKNGKVGYFDLNAGKIVIEPMYDLIVPYHNDDVEAIVKNDSVYGWVNHEFVYTKGFPAAHVQRWMSTFEYLRKPVSLKSGNQNLCEIPHVENIGNGIVMPPSYFVAHGLFESIESGISTTAIPINGWTEYKETQGTVFERLTDNINAVVTTIRQRYLEGREEFYTTNKLIFVNPALDTIHVSEIAGESLAISSPDSALLEVRTPHNYWFDENGVSLESNLVNYTYFRISKENTIEQLPQTDCLRRPSS